MLRKSTLEERMRKQTVDRVNEKTRQLARGNEKTNC
jgi:hypothetical protein